MPTTARPPFLAPDGKTVNPDWVSRYGFIVRSPKTGQVVHFPAFPVHPGTEGVTYCPLPKSLDFHESTAPNLLIEGSRGTGKSGAIRMDAHMRALSIPGYTYLVIRRTMPELRKTHLKFIAGEMVHLGGHYNKQEAIAYYPNGSLGFFTHCETEEDMMKLLGSDYCAIYFDEITTFTWDMITKISSCARVPEGSGLTDIVRGGTNPIGISATEVRRYFILKDILPDEDPDYLEDEYASIHTTLDDNPFVDRAKYIKQLKKLPEHIRRAWLDGEWVTEGAYFHDYKPMKVRADGESIPWHVVRDLPEIPSRAGMGTLESPFAWLRFYRVIDWGFSPDPAVCLWIASLPNGRAFVLKERTWYSTTAKEVAKAIKSESAGMRIVETYCDPTMFRGSQETDLQSIGDIFESNGVPLTPSLNDRAAIGFAIHEYLNTILDDGKPQLQIFEYECPMLVRTLGEMKVDRNNPQRIANGNDHWTIALGYFCMGTVVPSREYVAQPIPRWMRPNPNRTRSANARYLGHESVKRREG